jgi:DNA polymerase
MTISGADYHKNFASLLNWWEIAGVDHAFIEQPVNWLSAPPPLKRAPVAAKISAPAALPSKIPQPMHYAVPSDMPDNLAAFREWLTSDQQPEANWSEPVVVAELPPSPAICIVLDMPDAGATGSQICSEASHALLQNMLRAIGYDPSACGITSILIKRTMSGHSQNIEASHFRNRASRHLSLIAPQHILVMGNFASTCLFGQNAVEARHSKQKFNHSGSTIDATVTFHPRTLLQQPLLKAQAWQDIRGLAKKVQL